MAAGIRIPHPGAGTGSFAEGKRSPVEAGAMWPMPAGNRLIWWNITRGEKKELLGPFHKFACGDTVAWFEERVPLKVEADGRMFPVSDDSASIVD